MDHNDNPRSCPIANDPIGYLWSMHTPWNLLWRPYLVDHQHYGQRFMGQSAITGKLCSYYQYDHKIVCVECRPYVLQREADRIMAGFNGYDSGGIAYEMYASVLGVEHIDDVPRAVRKAGHKYVTLVINLGREYVVLTTGPLFAEGGSVLIENRQGFLRGVVMPLRWQGLSTANGKRRGISPSSGFLPPARSHDYWDVRQPGNRCWHLHPDRDEAELCRDQLNATSGKDEPRWHVQGTNGIWHLGKLEVTGEHLVDLLAELGIPFVPPSGYSGQVSTAADPWAVIFGPLEWTDPTFVELRRRSGWVPPPSFSPPPAMRAIRFDPYSQTITAG